VEALGSVFHTFVTTPASGTGILPESRHSLHQPTGFQLNRTLLPMPVSNTPRLSRPVVALALLSAMLPGNLYAQQSARQASADLFTEWLSGQRDLLSRVEAFSITAEVDHRVATPSGEQYARYGLAFNRDLDDPQGRGTLQYLVLDGDSLDVSERRRVERILSSMMTDELGPLLNGLNIPARLLSRVRAVGRPESVRENGRSLVRFVFELDPPERAQPPLQRPGMRPGVRPGVRPGAPGRRPPDGRMLADGPSAPRPRMVVFIDADTGALVRTRVRAILPGERIMVAETLFQRVEGIDLPLERHVSGDFPVRRRLRMVTVTLDHKTLFEVQRLAMSRD